MAKRGNIFTTVQTAKPRYNTFNLTHDRKFSCDFGKLIPICVMDAVPGDTFTIKPSAFVRFAPMIAPVMHRVNVFKHYFFVPNRIVWPEEGANKGFDNFISGGEDGMDTTVWAHTRYMPDSFSSGALPDYMGLPISTDIIGTSTNQEMPVSILPFMAYNKIWNEYYRDQNLQEKIVDKTGDGEQPISSEFMTVRERAWQHDYFTSALPWTQKGPEALLPLGTEAPVLAKEFDDPGNFVQWFRSRTTGTILAGSGDIGQNNGTPTQWDPLGDDVYLDLNNTHFADLSQATAASINDLRRAFALQSWLEKNARGGSRYTEVIHMHFGIKPQDARLQRPEYIGGCKTPVKISEVLQTSGAGLENDGTPLPSLSPQGNMAGHGVAVGGGKPFKYTCQEHGYIIGIMSVMPVSSYQQGFPRHFSRSDKFDYYWPSFAHIGEQPVYNRELGFSGDPNWNSGVFGYVPRYAEYKFMSNTVHGDFKNTLDFWHMSRKFSSVPNLNEDFISMDQSEVDRIFAVENPDSQRLWCQVLNEVTARRPMPIFGTPKIM